MSEVLVLSDPERPLPDIKEVQQHATVRFATSETLDDNLRDADVLFAWSFQSKALDSISPVESNLKWIHTASAGVDRLLTPSIVGSPITVTNSQGVFETALAEYVLTLILQFAKDTPGTLDSQRQGVWNHRDTELVEQSTAIIVGVGPIGRKISRYLNSIGVKTIGVGRRARDADGDFGHVYEQAMLQELLPNADYIVVVVPLTPQTRGMFDARSFTKMKHTARLINVGRGEIVVEEDLIAALDSGQIQNAALDVFETEPLPSDSPLWRLPNVIVSPHMAGDYGNRFRVLADLFVENFTLWSSGSKLKGVVDKEAGYVTDVTYASNSKLNTTENA